MSICDERQPQGNTQETSLTDVEYSQIYQSKEAMYNCKIFNILIFNYQIKDYGLTSRHKQDIVDNIDAWAMWISPPLFVIWNFCYWIFYQI